MATTWTRLFVPSASLVVAVFVATSVQSAALVRIAFAVPAAVSLHEPVLARITIVNASGIPISIDCGGDRHDNFLVLSP